MPARSLLFTAPDCSDYHESVFVLSRRVVEGVVVLFALLGFVFVPLGKKTGFEHAVAVARTNAAAEAVRELWLGGERLRRKLIGALNERLRDRARAPVPSAEESGSTH